MRTHPPKLASRLQGFTIAELLVAMTISGIVLAAVATLAFATGKADKALDAMLTGQKFVQFDTTQITDALRYSRRIFQTPSGNIALWKADDEAKNYGEGSVANNRINGSELLFFRVEGSDLRLYRFEFAFDPSQGKTTKTDLTIPTLGEAGSDELIRLDVTVAEIQNDTAFAAMTNLAATHQYVKRRVAMKLPDKLNPDEDASAGVKMVFSDVLFTFPNAPDLECVNLGLKLTVKRVNDKGQVVSQIDTPYNFPLRLLCSADNLIVDGVIVQEDDD